MHKHGCGESNRERKVPGVGQAVGCTYGAFQTPGSGPKKENREEQFSAMSIKWDPKNKSFFYLLCSHSFNEFFVEIGKKKSGNMTYVWQGLGKMVSDVERHSRKEEGKGKSRPLRASWGVQQAPEQLLSIPTLARHVSSLLSAQQDGASLICLWTTFLH